jgi:hypothetical protein
VVGGFFSLSFAIMSTVSAGGESNVAALTMREVNKFIDLFSKRLLTAPEEPVSLTNAPEVRKWLQLAKDEVVRIIAMTSIPAKRLQENLRDCYKDLVDEGSTMRLPRSIRNGLDLHDRLATGLREVGSTANMAMARSSSGTSLRPEDSASHVSFGSVARSSVQEGLSRSAAPASRQAVPEVPVVDFKKPAARPRTRSKVAPAVGSELMSPQQVRW